MKTRKQKQASLSRRPCAVVYEMTESSKLKGDS